MKGGFLLLALCINMFCMACNNKKAEPEAQGKVLVAYFSATGTTARAAGRIAKETGGELFEIKPAAAYTAADLDWTDKQSRSSIEMADTEARPELAGVCEEIAQYDTIYVGFPIWWYVAPRIINTFIEAHDLSGKVLIPFATSGGSPIGPCVDALRETYPELDIRQGKLMNR